MGEGRHESRMKKIINLIVAIICFCAAMSLRAQTTNVYLQTFFVLTGVKQEGAQAVSIRVTNKDVLAALNATGNFNFSSGAQLLLKSYEDQLPIFVVRETSGTQVTTTDVSNYLSLSEPSEVDTRNKLISFAIRVFTLNNQEGTSFELTGFTTMYRGFVNSPGIGTLTRVYNAGSQVSGYASLGGSQAVLQGNVFAGFAKAERD